MRTTVELPDDLLAELKVIAVREHRHLRDVLQEIVSLGLRSRRTQAASDADESQADTWLHDWQGLGRRIEAESSDPRSCVDILLSDRR